MEKYYSKIDKEKLLHIIHRFEDNENKRLDIVPADNFIQCSYLKLENGKTFKPHKHIKKERTYKEQIAQESWIVVRGSVRCIFYDLNDEIIATPILKSGDASFTLAAGHNYEILEEGTIVYEYKTGPYEGQLNDKVFLGDK
jgi:cupin fold WbuC family metalloprotein